MRTLRSTFMAFISLRQLLDHAAEHGIVAIHAQVFNTHLVMHGSSSLPQEWLAIIREFGGDIKETYGVSVEEIHRRIQSGVRKVNMDTDIRLSMSPSEPRRILSRTAGL